MTRVYRTGGTSVVIIGSPSGPFMPLPLLLVRV